MAKYYPVTIHQELAKTFLISVSEDEDHLDAEMKAEELIKLGKIQLTSADQFYIDAQADDDPIDEVTSEMRRFFEVIEETQEEAHS